MARWEDTAFDVKITEDPIEALIKSQTIDPFYTKGEWDDVYGEQEELEEATGQQVHIECSPSCNPIEPRDHTDFPVLNQGQPVIVKTERDAGTRSPSCSMKEKMKALTKENAQLLLDRKRLEKRVAELENRYYEAISGMSNHKHITSKDHNKLSATILMDGREVFVNNISPQMSGRELSEKVYEISGENPGNMIVMQHLPIHPDLPLGHLGLGSRPFYAISIGHRKIEPGRSIKVQLLGRGPLI